MIFQEQVEKAKAEKIFVKCVVWDLDNTIWQGVLLEDKEVVLLEEAVALIKELDRRGILNSIASKNNFDAAWSQLEAFGIAEYFLYPEINWNPKSASISAIAQSLNIGVDAFAFVDDSQFEREEVKHELPGVLCLDAAEMDKMWKLPQLMPRFITSESRLRRQMYMSDIQRNRVEDSFTGNNEDFLATLGMVFKIKQADEADLQRAEELTIRTNQLNTTGYTYSYHELNELRQSPKHLLFVSSLEDKYGTYGTIGLALVAKDDAFWTVKLLLMSCRVMSRGVGTIMMSYIMEQTKAAGVRLRAEFVPNGRNRMMYVTYKFGGFREIDQQGDLIVFENELDQIQPFPAYVNVKLPD